MIRYTAVRLAATVPVLLGISVVLFGLVRLIPGDPGTAILLAMAEPGADLSTLDQDLAAVRAGLGLDASLPVQYWNWLCDIVTGNLGTSFRSGAPVFDELMLRLPATLKLAGAAFVVMLIIAIPTGILGAVRHDQVTDKVTRLLALVGVSVPSFLVGILLLYAFAVNLQWFPTVGSDGLAGIVLPAVALGIGLAASTSRLLRVSMLDALSQPYTATAEAKGLPWRTIVLRHALRNALLPVLTQTGLLVGGLLGGAVIIETVFSYGGVGRYVIDAIAGRDYPVIQAFALAMAVVYVVVNLVVDLLYRLVDPRVRLAGATS